jgi:hypothetical protein
MLPGRDDLKFYYRLHVWVCNLYQNSAMNIILTGYLIRLLPLNDKEQDNFSLYDEQLFRKHELKVCIPYQT